MYLDQISLSAQFLLLNLKRSEIEFGFRFLCSLIKCLISSNEVLVVQSQHLSSEYMGYLVHFLAPSPKNKKIYTEKIVLLFQKKFFLIFWDGTSQPQPQKAKKKNHPEEISYIFPKEVFLTFRDDCSSIRKIKKSSIL